jgi:hypothetical protein
MKSIIGNIGYPVGGSEQAVAVVIEGEVSFITSAYHGDTYAYIQSSINVCPCLT